MLLGTTYIPQENASESLLTLSLHFHLSISFALVVLLGALGKFPSFLESINIFIVFPVSCNVFLPLFRQRCGLMYPISLILFCSSLNFLFINSRHHAKQAKTRLQASAVLAQGTSWGIVCYLIYRAIYSTLSWCHPPYFPLLLILPCYWTAFLAILSLLELKCATSISFFSNERQFTCLWETLKLLLQVGYFYSLRIYPPNILLLVGIRLPWSLKCIPTLFGKNNCGATVKSQAPCVRN